MSASAERQRRPREPRPATGDEPRRITVYLPSGLAVWVRDQSGRSIDKVLLDAYVRHHQTVDRDLATQLNALEGLPVRRRRRKTDAELVAVSLYLTDAERKVLNRSARRVGMSMSAYATALVERARAEPSGPQANADRERLS